MSRLRLTPSARTSKAAIIPLDLAPALPEVGRFDQFVLRVCGLPFGAALSKGHNNGDQSWTVTADDLIGLTYLPPATVADHHLEIRVIGLIEGEAAEVLNRFDLPVGADGRVSNIAVHDRPAKRMTDIDYGRVKARIDGHMWADRAPPSPVATRDGDRLTDSLFALLTRLEETETQLARLSKLMIDDLPAIDFSETPNRSI